MSACVLPECGSVRRSWGCKQAMETVSCTEAMETVSCTALPLYAAHAVWASPSPMLTQNHTAGGSAFVAQIPFML